MVQFNLLPDVKIEYIKANRLKRSLMTISFVVAVSSVTIALLMFLAVDVVQKKHLNDLNKDLVSAVAQLRSTPDVDKIITVQNQLSSLPALHNTKPASSRLFGYLGQITPAAISITNATVDFTASTMTISGNAKDLLSVNTYVDTLKFTTYTKDAASTPEIKAFSKVLLTGFSSGDKNATYQISLSYDAEIFKNQSTVSLVVPNTNTTRSQLSQPNALFESAPTVKTGSP